MRLEIDVLLTELELADQFIQALSERCLGEKFFYWLPLSVQAWLALCAAEQPYKNYSRSMELISAHARRIGAEVSAREIEVVSLGSGQGDKDVVLLRALKEAGAGVSYLAVDSSAALLEMAVAAAAREGFRARGLKADVAAETTVQALAAGARAPRLYLILGNNLGIIEPLEFAAALRSLMRTGDFVLIDAELFDPRATMAGYDNPVNRRFAFAPLASAGIEEGRDGELVLETRPDGRLQGLFLVEKFFRVKRPLSLNLSGQRLDFAAGEKIAMSPSWKYSREALREILKRAGKFRWVAENSTADECFVQLLGESVPG